MWKYIVIFLFTFYKPVFTSAQQILPNIGVTNYNGKIIVNWKNAYTVPVANISIQRSYDSLKNYTTIGSVLNPQNEENGYSDNEPPYNKMYYRAFIAFEGGSYLISKTVRPVKTPLISDSTGTSLFPWQVDPFADSSIQSPPVVKGVFIPSLRIFTAKDNNVIIHLPEVAHKKYTVKFFNESEKEIFELKELKDEYLIIEKVNFIRAGWYFFEIYEEGILLEKNKFLVPKDGKINNN